jgi:nitroreductase
MESAAQTTIHELLAQRWSPRAFDPEHTLSEADLQALLQAAQWAPSSMNEQPWRYRFARRGEDGFEALFQTLMPGNQLWAGRASLLMACLVDPHFKRNGKPNRHAWHDAGAANMALSLEATRRGLHVHQMGGFDAEAVMAIDGVDAAWEAVCVLAIGQKSDPSTLPEKLEERENAPRQRMDLEQFAAPLSSS